MKNYENLRKLSHKEIYTLLEIRYRIFILLRSPFIYKDKNRKTFLEKLLVVIYNSPLETKQIELWGDPIRAKKSLIISVANDSHNLDAHDDAPIINDLLDSKHDDWLLKSKSYYGIDVDLQAPDHFIKEAFSNWLKAARQIQRQKEQSLGLDRLNGGRPKFATIESEIDRIIKGKVIQYLDLFIYQIEQNIFSNNADFKTIKLDDIEKGMESILDLDRDNKTMRDTTRRIVRQITDNQFNENPSWGNPYLEYFRSLL